MVIRSTYLHVVRYPAPYVLQKPTLSGLQLSSFDWNVSLLKMRYLLGNVSSFLTFKAEIYRFNDQPLNKEQPFELYGGMESAPSHPTSLFFTFPEQ